MVGGGPIRAVLFDYGHTLVDFGRTQEALLEAYRQIRERIEAALSMEAPEVGHLIDRVANEVDRLVTRSYEERRMQELDLVRVFDEVLLGALGLTVPPDVVRHIVALDHSAFSRSVTVSGETLAVLRGLRGRGLRLGLVSNVALLPDLMQADLDALGLGELLDASTFSSGLGVRKPDGRIFRHTLDRVGVPAAEAVFVGDRRYDDVMGARDVGMRTVRMAGFRDEAADPAGGGGPSPGEEADAVIRDLRELPGILRELERAS